MRLYVLMMPLILTGCAGGHFDTRESTSLVLPIIIQYEGKTLDAAALEAEERACPVHIEFGKDYVLTRDRIRIAKRSLESNSR